MFLRELYGGLKVVWGLGFEVMRDFYGLIFFARFRVFQFRALREISVLGVWSCLE